MTLVKSPSELGTALTDLFLAAECLFILIWLKQVPNGDRIRVFLWCGFFALVFFASLLGAAAHGLEIRPPLRAFLFALVFSALGVAVPLLAAGSLSDLQVWEAGRGWVLFIPALTLTLLLSALFFPRSRPLFVVFAALAYFTALIVYLHLTLSSSLKGAGWIAAALIVGLFGAWVQRQKFTLPFLSLLDQNGVFHLIAMVALIILARGVRLGM